MNSNSSHIELNGQRFEIRRRAYQRNLILRVQPDGSLRVSCACSVPRAEIEKFLLKNQNFIERSLRKVGEFRERHPRLEFISGETILLRGKRLRLDVIWTMGKQFQIAFLNDRLELVAPLGSTRGQRQQAIMKAYAEKAEEIFPEEVTRCSKVMFLYPDRLQVKTLRGKWGSCSIGGTVQLNWKLLAAPPEVLTYVVMHELAHLLHPNHSAAYWKVVGTYCPKYKAQQKWLRENHYEFEFLEPKSALHEPINENCD